MLPVVYHIWQKVRGSTTDTYRSSYNNYGSIPFLSGGGVLHQIVGSQVQHMNKIGPNQIQGFVKMRGQKDLKSMKKGVNWIENQGENWNKILKIC